VTPASDSDNTTDDEKGSSKHSKNNKNKKSTSSGSDESGSDSGSGSDSEDEQHHENSSGSESGSGSDSEDVVSSDEDQDSGSEESEDESQSKKKSKSSTANGKSSAAANTGAGDASPKKKRSREEDDNDSGSDQESSDDEKQKKNNKSKPQKKAKTSDGDSSSTKKKSSNHKDDNSSEEDSEDDYEDIVEHLMEKIGKTMPDESIYMEPLVKDQITPETFHLNRPEVYNDLVRCKALENGKIDEDDIHTLKVYEFIRILATSVAPPLNKFLEEKFQEVKNQIDEAVKEGKPADVVAKIYSKAAEKFPRAIINELYLQGKLADANVRKNKTISVRLKKRFCRYKDPEKFNKAKKNWLRKNGAFTKDLKNCK